MTPERFTDYLEKTLQLSEDMHQNEHAYYQPDASVWHSTRVEGLPSPKKRCGLCLAGIRIAQTALAQEKAMGNLKPVRFEKEQGKLMALDFFREGDLLIALSCFYEPYYPARVIQRADTRYREGTKPTEMEWPFKSFHGWTQYLTFVADVRAHMDEIKSAEDEFRTCLTMETTDEPVKTLDAERLSQAPQAGGWQTSALLYAGHSGIPENTQRDDTERTTTHEGGHRD